MVVRVASQSRVAARLLRGMALGELSAPPSGAPKLARGNHESSLADRPQRGRQQCHTHVSG